MDEARDRSQWLVLSETLAAIHNAGAFRDPKNPISASRIDPYRSKDEKPIKGTIQDARELI